VGKIVVTCPYCKSENITIVEIKRYGIIYKCENCNRKFMDFESQELTDIDYF